MAQTILDRKIGPIPPSGLGPDGKLRVMTEEEHRQYIESALRRIDEIEQIPDDPNDPPEEEWMRAIENSVLIGPCSKDATESCGNLSCSIPAHWGWLAGAMDHRFLITAASGSED